MIMRAGNKKSNPMCKERSVYGTWRI